MEVVGISHRLLAAGYLIRQEFSDYLSKVLLGVAYHPLPQPGHFRYFSKITTLLWQLTLI
jgi:hypothetical protein